MYSCLFTHRLRGHHFVDALLILLSQDCQLASLLILQGLEHRLVLSLGHNFHLVVAQGLVLLGLHLTCVLELLLNLQLQSLVGTEMGRKSVTTGQEKNRIKISC